MKDNQKTRQEIQADAGEDEALEESFPASDAPSYNRGMETQSRRPRDLIAPDELMWTAGGEEQSRNWAQRNIKTAAACLLGGVALGVIWALLPRTRTAAV